MEYQVSARKYRPMTFASVVGQEALTTTLKNAVQSGKLAHAFLFCGPRGVGKTTCARIFAKTINCEHITADGEACGECESCKSFAEQRSLNVFELDAASNNGVEHIKQLIDQTRIPPQVGRYKVFIIDEVHMLSTAAFNAFLKTLEEPPTYVIFILATTEKNKLLPTIISRCQIYDFDRMTVANTVNHLKMVAEREGYTYEDEALEIIAEKADGGMRDALSIFDQAASFCQGNITVEKVVRDLNLMDVENYFRIIDLSLENKCTDVMLLLNKMLGSGMDGGNIVSGLAAHLRNVMMAKDPQTIELLEASKRYSERYKEQAQRCSGMFLFKSLQILTRCDLNYRQSSNKRLLVELTLIEVAQVTQPADADASAPRWGRRLKSLFKHIIKRQPKPAEQVAGAVGNSDNQSTADSPAVVQPTNTVTESPQASQPTAAAPPRPSPTRARPNIKSVGMSFTSMNQAKEVETAAEEMDVTNKGEMQSFDNDQLRLEWLRMCNRMAENKQFLGLSSSMKNITPVITNFPKVEVVVNHKILLDQLRAIHSRIKVTLAQRLHNGNLDLTIRLAEQQEIKPLLTKREIFQRMYGEMPIFKELVDKLGLELAQ